MRENSAEIDAKRWPPSKNVAEASQRDAHYKVVLQAYIGKSAAQRKLTEARLSAVRKALIEAGIDKERIRVRKHGSAKAVILSRAQGRQYQDT